MADKQPKNTNASGQQDHQNLPPRTQKKHSRALLLLFLVFFAFVTTVFLTQRKDTIGWIEDYEAGLKLAEQKNKPVLLAFFKLHTRYCSEMQQNTYNNPDVIEYVETNFIPILIDVDKHPQIAERYNIGYYPTHYIKYPHSDKLVGPHIGSDSPSIFIKKLDNLLRKMDLPAE